MSEPLLAVLKLCLLALLYLFFFRVLRAVWVETKPPADLAGFVPASRSRRSRRPKRSTRAKRTPRAATKRAAPSKLLVLEPAEHKGRSYEIGAELTLGRAGGCQIALDDNFASQLHAKVYPRDGRYLVEDLGSTNGTYLNRERVTGPMVMQPGDRLQVGNTVVELT